MLPHRLFDQFLSLSCDRRRHEAYIEQGANLAFWYKVNDRRVAVSRALSFTYSHCHLVSAAPHAPHKEGKRLNRNIMPRMLPKVIHFMIQANYK